MQVGLTQKLSAQKAFAPARVQRGALQVMLHCVVQIYIGSKRVDAAPKGCRYACAAR